MSERAIDSPPIPIAVSAVGRVIAQARVPLYRNALVLMVTSGVTAALGFIFWALVARLYPPAQVGLASATISSALFLATFAQLGLPYALVRFGSGAGADRPTLMTTVVLVVTAAAAGAGVLFVAGLDLWAPALAGLAERPLLGAIVIALAGLTAASTVLGYVAVASRDTRPSLAGGTTQGVIKILLVVGFALTLSRLGFEVVGAWLVATAAAVLAQAWLLRAHLAPRVSLRALRLGTFLHYSAGNYLGDLTWHAPVLLFPLLVVGLLGAEANAYFYVGWAIAGLLAAIPAAATNSLLAEGSHSYEETAAHLRKAVGLTLALLLPAIALCWLAAPLILQLFGPAYAANSTDTLRILSFAALPLSLNLLHLTVARIERRIRRLLAISVATGGGTVLLGAVLAAQLGVTGIALGYLVAQSVAATVLTAEWWLRGGARS
ncbi:MAG: lipopolysaccharide biosynthesis protein [Candidatus Dormibacteria bacterium]